MPSFLSHRWLHWETAPGCAPPYSCMVAPRRGERWHVSITGSPRGAVGRCMNIRLYWQRENPTGKTLENRENPTGKTLENRENPTGKTPAHFIGWGPENLKSSVPPWRYLYKHVCGSRWEGETTPWIRRWGFYFVEPLSSLLFFIWSFCLLLFTLYI